ncbi:MAG: DNA gyrase inhibitor YacG [Deltaproteobacteria bacterium]|nr:DNA gyrase inhibitor YacG [Deltaproteobacteria bacterium]
MPKDKPHPCPHCRALTLWEGNPYRPFCSERCRQIDLGQWAMETYRIPGEPANAADDAEAETSTPELPSTPPLRIIR